MKHNARTQSNSDIEEVMALNFTPHDKMLDAVSESSGDFEPAMRPTRSDSMPQFENAETILKKYSPLITSKNKETLESLVEKSRENVKYMWKSHIEHAKLDVKPEDK